ncbi:MAG: InlB B-repeat-containing protein [Chitinispirillaceae bacterium]|nr:InlB B-repeat-containing protein [Chitinispirillaceae bacterium]
MLKNRFIIVGAVTILLSLLFIFHCELPQDPTDPSNTSVSVILVGSEWDRQNNHSITDTMGNAIRIGAVINLPENIDSIGITISADGVSIIDTIFKDFTSDTRDTVWKKICFVSSGTKAVTITPYSSLNISPIVAVIIIVERVGPPNKKPSIAIPENIIIQPTETCSLAITVSDADDDQTLTVTMAGEADGATLQSNSLFTWTAPEDFLGSDTVTFVVTDNGKPPQSDTAIAVITVTITPHPPTITVTGSQSIKPLETCTLTIRVVDEDAGKVLNVSMVGNPEGSEIRNDSLFIWTVPAGFSGEYDVRFTVTDDGTPQLSNSFDVRITVSAGAVNHAPKWNLDILPLVLNDTASYSLQLSTVCSDPDGNPLTYSALAGTPAGDTVIGNLYSFEATAEEIGKHMVVLVAIDPEGAKDTLVIALTVEAKASDNTPPIITLIAPEKDSGATTSATFTIDVICSDASGVTSVSATFGSTTIPAVFSEGHYTMTVSGFQPGVYNTIILSAIDASANANENTKTVYIKFNPTFTVTYNGNGNTGGTVPFDAGEYEAGATVTVKANTGNLVKTGTNFAGWNTTDDGSGTAYAVGATLRIRFDTTLYARWTIKKYTVTYLGNNQSSGSAPVDATPHDSNSTVTLLGNTGNLARTGYNFDGWNTANDGSGTSYTAGGSLAAIKANVTLYAKWTVAQCQVSFNTYGGTSVPTQSVNYGSYATEPTSTRSGLTLVGWYRESGHTNRWDFSTQTVTGPITLHAKWLVMDKDENVYDTVRIGSQTWMVQNLKTTKYRDGTPITQVADSVAWSNRTSAAFCWPYNMAVHGATYGALYNRFAANAANITPSGWHVPSSAEYRQLLDYLVGISVAPEDALLQVGATPGATNSSGFTGIPSPLRSAQGGFSASGESAIWWTTSNQALSVGGMIPYWFVGYDAPWGLSIRCVKD